MLRNLRYRLGNIFQKIIDPEIQVKSKLKFWSPNVKCQCFCFRSVTTGIKDGHLYICKAHCSKILPKIAENLKILSLILLKVFWENCKQANICRDRKWLPNKPIDNSILFYFYKFCLSLNKMLQKNNYSCKKDRE